MSFMSEEERKKPWKYEHAGYVFNTHVDLSGGITVQPPQDHTETKLASAVTHLIAYFTMNTWPRLNGFPGFDSVRWKFLEPPKKKPTRRNTQAKATVLQYLVSVHVNQPPSKITPEIRKKAKFLLLNSGWHGTTSVEPRTAKLISTHPK